MVGDEKEKHKQSQGKKMETHNQARLLLGPTKYNYGQDYIVFRSLHLIKILNKAAASGKANEKATYKSRSVHG